MCQTSKCRLPTETLVALAQRSIGERTEFERDAVVLGRLGPEVVDGEVVVVHEDRHIAPALDRGDAADVVEVCVRKPDRLQLVARLVDGVEQRVAFVAGIDQDGNPRRLVGDEVAVLLEGSHHEAFDLHDAPPAVASAFWRSLRKVRYFSAATAAVVASPTAVVTCLVSCTRTSPAAKRPGIVVCICQSVIT